jgi:uncharacterized BrkB/YihY/UPF0761 family membrane protein
MTIGLVGLRVFAAFWLSRGIVYNYVRYGPLGIVFMLLTWLIALSVVMLGGPVLGAALHERRLQEQAPPKAGATSTELIAGLREKAGRLVPPPRARDEEPSTGGADEQ